MNAVRIPSIRSRLLLLVFACIAPVTLMAAVLIAYDYQRQHDQLLKDSLTASRIAAAGIDRELGRIESALLALAASPHLTNNDLPAFYVQAHDALLEQNASNFVLSDIDGSQRINTLRPFGFQSPLRTGAQISRTIFQTGRTLVSGLITGQVSQQSLVVVAVPVRRYGQVKYALSAGIFVDRLADQMARHHLPADWIGIILDEKGTIIARTHDMQRYLGKPGARELTERSERRLEDSFEMTTLEGFPVLASFTRSTASRWTIAVGIPQENLSRSLWKSIFWAIAAMLLLLAGGMALAWRIADRIAGSLRQLSGSALALGAGHKVAVPALHLHESNEIGRALTHASEMLQQARHDANHDLATGLPNQGLFVEILRQQLAVCGRKNSELAVFDIALDGIRTVQSLHGDEVAEQLQFEVTKRLKASMRQSDVPARKGSDEFAALMLDAGAGTAGGVAAKLVQSLSLPYKIGDRIFSLSVSIGVAIYPSSAHNAETLLARAATAREQAREAFADHFVIADKGDVTRPSA